MRLIHYTLKRLSIVLIFIMSIWACLFYVNILDEIMDETNDTLENNKERIIKQMMRDGVTLGERQDMMTSYIVREISPEQATHYRERYFDSTRFYEVELEYDPVRVLKTTFRSPDNRSYELTVMVSTLEQDDMIEAIVIWIVILYATLLICILAVTELVFRKSLRPLHQLLHWLKRFTPGVSTKPLENLTQIKEFRQLNDTINQMAHRSEEVYQQQRQFIENASHELQTPLAICQNKLELLAEQLDGDEQALQHIDEIQQTIHRVVKLNKSLLLLSRIENRQFHDEKTVSFNTLVHRFIEDLSEIYEHKEIQLTIQEEGDLTRQMNESLASTLVANLLKNLFLHAQSKTVAEIRITPRTLHFANHGSYKPLDTSRLFSRFYQSDNKKPESNGLGLAIVKSICSLYDIRISYHFDGRHNFTLEFL